MLRGGQNSSDPPAISALLIDFRHTGFLNHGPATRTIANSIHIDTSSK
jgi:hypothetical protein